MVVVDIIGGLLVLALLAGILWLGTLLRRLLPIIVESQEGTLIALTNMMVSLDRYQHSIETLTLRMRELQLVLEVSLREHAEEEANLREKVHGIFVGRMRDSGQLEALSRDIAEQVTGELQAVHP